MRLSPRELEVVALTAEGLIEKEVATRMGISPRTIDAMKVSIFNKLNVHSALAMVMEAQRAGLIPCACSMQDVRGVA